jgi:hypothetical protein
MVGGGTIGKVACPEEAGVGSGGLEGREEDRLSVWDFSQTWADAGKERAKEADAWAVGSSSGSGGWDENGTIMYVGQEGAGSTFPGHHEGLCPEALPEILESAGSLIPDPTGSERL